MNDNITAIILSGGRGRRFDDRDKGLLPWRDRPLIEHVITRLLPQVDQLLINCNRNRDRYGAFGYAVFTDNDTDFAGPLAGVMAARGAVTHPWCLLSANDTPLLPDDLVKQLLAHLQRHDADVAYPLCGDRHHYLPALIRSDRLEHVVNYLAEGGRSLHGWYAQLSTVTVDFSERAAAFANINDPSALAALDSR